MVGGCVTTRRGVSLTEENIYLEETWTTQLRRARVDPQDWSIVLIRANSLTGKGLDIATAVRTAHNDLRGMTRLERDLLPT